MSIIHDALKKAQEDRKNKKEEIPYNPLGAQKKSRTLVYAIIGFCVIAIIIAYFYVPNFQKTKQAALSVAVPNIVPAKPVQVTASVGLKNEDQKDAVTHISGKIPLPPALSKEEKEKSVVSPQPLRKNYRDKKVMPSQLPSTKKDRGDLPESTGAQERVIVGKAEDHNINRMYNEALKELQSGKVKEAKNIYKQILAKRPNHIETLNNLGVIAMEENNKAEALFYFKKILEYEKNYPKAYNNIGLVAMKDGDGKLAEEYFRKAISIDPDGSEPYLNLAALLRSEGKFEEAAKLLDIPIQKKIKDPALFLSYAVIKDNLGRYADASRYYRLYLASLHAPESRKDIIERLKYIEEKGSRQLGDKP